MKYLLSGNFLIYKVKRFDSHCSIAIKFNTTAEDICKDNNLTCEIVEGQTLFVQINQGSIRTANPFEYPYPFARIVNYEQN